MQLRSLSWLPILSLAKVIVYNANAYFIAEKVNKGTLIHRKFEVFIHKICQRWLVCKASLGDEAIKVSLTLFILFKIDRLLKTRSCEFG